MKKVKACKMIKWTAHWGYHGDVITAKAEFRGTLKKYIMVDPKNQSEDDKVAFRYGEEFFKDDAKICDTEAEALIILANKEKRKIGDAKAMIISAKERLEAIRKFSP